MQDKPATIEPAKIDWDSDDCPTSPVFADKYYSRTDPLGESQYVFLAGTDAPARWREQRDFTIGETGFGTGLNFLLTWDAWRRTPGDGWLTYISVEKHPMDEGARARALAPFAELASLTTQLAAQIPPPFPGPHRITFPKDRVRLILVIGDAAESLERLTGPVDAWYLDGFAPSRNPDMWRPRLFSAMAKLSSHGATLSTFTAASAVRRGLTEAGFDVAKRPGFAGKRESILASYSGELAQDWTASPWFTPTKSSPPPLGSRVAILGAGIAGLSAAQALRRHGLQPILIDRAPPASGGSSGLPAALIAPKLNREESDYARFWISAFLDAVRSLDTDAGNAWIGSRGLSIEARSDKDFDKQRALAERLTWDSDWLSVIDDCPGLSVPRAGVVSPQKLARTLADGIEFIGAEVTGLSRHSNSWRIETAEASCIEAETVVFANGAWVNDLLPKEDHLPIRSEFGCVAIYPEETPPPASSKMKDGYVTASTPPVLGAALRHGSARPEEDWTPGDRERDRLAATAERLGMPIPGSDPPSDAWQLWSAWRATSPDHLPLIGPVPDATAFRKAYEGLKTGKRHPGYPPSPTHPGLHVVAALGPRGFQAAFLAADLLASRILGLPLPVDAQMRDALDPARFLVRELRRGGNR